MTAPVLPLDEQVLHEQDRFLVLGCCFPHMKLIVPDFRLDVIHEFVKYFSFEIKCDCLQTFSVPNKSFITSKLRSELGCPIKGCTYVFYSACQAGISVSLWVRSDCSELGGAARHT